MTLNLIKLSVGPKSLADLAARQEQYLKSLKRSHQPQELMHITRQMPKRAEELLDGGSIYWVIKGWIFARQKLIELRPVIYNGIPHCGLIFEKELIRVSPRPRRPFQGWRYLETKDAPPDISIHEDYKNFPDKLLKELAEIGLI